MSATIRLKRLGKNPKKRPYFRIAVFSKSKGRDSRFIEELGFYNPVTGAAKVNKERYAYWVSKGAQPSLTVKNLAKKAA